MVRLSHCHECDKPFAPARSDALYCGAACRERAFRRRRKDELIRLRAIARKAGLLPPVTK